ncbi:urea ABC transporter permease subunit UrtB [Uliginosibacterium sp. TH139]|uniref:urea ABC transporter permease subunit UrtB n=1 Tax=Uliginosibacterium sp. TH139 TaxID=2067453 RepID=UPI0020B160DE|nr:urea ABC transporter permease subunit UrtB [Uliginosibacterium sp. TH139]
MHPLPLHAGCAQRACIKAIPLPLLQPASPPDTRALRPATPESWIFKTAMTFMRPALLALLSLALTLASPLGLAKPAPELILQLATGDNDAKVAALYAIAGSADPEALPILEALRDDTLKSLGGKQAIIFDGETASDAISGEKLAKVPDELEDVVSNNRVTNALDGAFAALALSSADQSERLEAVKKLQDSANPAILPLLDKALATESDPQIAKLLRLTQAAAQLQHPDKAIRLAAIQTLGGSGEPNAKVLLGALLEKEGSSYREADEALRVAAQQAINSINSHLKLGEAAGGLFTGLSLGSILLLAALGLAITYGLMGVINMAHGELIMIGAYAAYAVQNLIRAHAPGLFEFYPLIAIPVSFCASALVGVAMERLVIRHLYGRPLETLLATWGISLMLIQAVRSLFGAQNVMVENPAWLSGGVQVMSNLILPYNRLAIIAFAVLVVIGMGLILSRTRLGLFVRAVTQNRQMASCVGVATPRVDTLAFGLGSGIAGLAGCALAQVGNVGPDLGQGYIIDSFMVVVLGGVGQLAGTVYAALGLGVLNKLLEGFAGAVLAKIAVLVFIIIFIQKRPQGLFAVKGRFVDN